MSAIPKTAHLCVAIICCQMRVRKKHINFAQCETACASIMMITSTAVTPTKCAAYSRVNTCTAQAQRRFFTQNEEERKRAKKSKVYEALRNVRILFGIIRRWRCSVWMISLYTPTHQYKKVMIKAFVLFSIATRWFPKEERQHYSIDPSQFSVAYRKPFLSSPSSWSLLSYATAQPVFT